MFYFTRIYVQKCNRWVYSSCMLCFIKNCQTAFQNDCTILDSYQQYMNIHSSVNPYQQLMLSLFFILAIMIGRWWCTIVVLICIAIVANDFKHLFTWLVATCVSFLVKRLFILLFIFELDFCLFALVDFVLFFLVSFESFFFFNIFYTARSLLDMWFANISPRFYTYTFYPVEEQNV